MRNILLRGSVAQGTFTIELLGTIYVSTMYTRSLSAPLKPITLAPAEDDEMKPTCIACCCRLLIYTPRHPFIRQALSAVTKNVLSNFTSHRVDTVIRLTGPIPFHQSGVQPEFEGNGCDAPAGLPNQQAQL